jgi:hypothetical protein
MQGERRTPPSEVMIGDRALGLLEMRLSESGRSFRMVVPLIVDRINNEKLSSRDVAVEHCRQGLPVPPGQRFRRSRAIIAWKRFTASKQQEQGWVPTFQSDRGQRRAVRKDASEQALQLVVGTVSSADRLDGAPISRFGVNSQIDGADFGVLAEGLRATTSRRIPPPKTPSVQLLRSRRTLASRSLS